MLIKIFIIVVIIIILCIWVFWLHLCLCTVCIPRCSQRPEQGIISSGTGVMDTCKPVCGFWGSNLGVLQKQSVLLITDLSLQPLILSLKKKKNKRKHGRRRLICVGCTAKRPRLHSHPKQT